VEIPGVGTVRVRGISRVELLGIRKATDDSTMDGPRVLDLERRMVALAMVDPVMTEAQVGEWQKVAPAGEVDKISNAISELSGLVEGAPKSGVQTV
ncbi:MAG TPA: hypothetical protein VFQ37_14335, partial [Mycobacterium sp.]|nr:hypothetical protein [Mycobacterium sp.]